jgi:PAS domain S-box-containing protein
MISLSLTRPREGLPRALAFAAAILLPLFVVAALGGLVNGPGVLLLALPVLVVAGFGGVGPGLLATAVGAMPPVLHFASTGGSNGIPWLGAYLILGVTASVLIERTRRLVGGLREERDRLHDDHRFQEAIADLAGDCAWQGHLEGTRLLLDRATPTFAAALGLSTGEVNTRGGWTALVHPADRGAFAGELRALADAGRTSSELRYEVRGAVLWLQCEMRQLKEEEGGNGLIVGAVRDVTTRHELVAQLRESKERHEATVMAAGLMLCEFDFEKREATFAGNCEAVLGRWPSELSGPLDAWLERVHPDDVPRLEKAFEAARTLGHPLQVEYRVRHANGRYVTLAHGGYAVRDAEGPARLVGFLRDVTEEKTAAAQIQRLNDQLQDKVRELETVFDLAPIGLGFGTDPKCETIIANEALAAMLGGTPHTNVSLTRPEAPPEIRAFRGGREIPTSELPMQRAAAIARPIVNEEIELRFPDGHALVMLSNAAPLYDEHGDVRGCVGAFADVTEQRHLKSELQRRLEELRQSDKRKDEFLATLAHELRNPLAPIRNASMLLGLQDGSAQSIDWVRRVIDRQTDHLARLIDDLLDVSRITRDKLTLRLERVELSRVVDNAIEAVRSQIDAQRHRLTVNVPDGLWLQGDQVRLTQIFSNLLNNAVKYTSPGGAIEVTASVDDTWVSVSVRDNGVGIPPDQLGHLFEMFYQVDRTIERAHAGLGIGLTLVQRLVRMHGGEVSVRSEGIGRGSEFTVRLPLADRPARPEPSPQATGRAVRGLRILVADDSVDSALTLTALLSAAGHDVQAVHDGFAALQRAAEFRPHVLVLDIGMPGLNGYDTCRRIRAEPWGRNAVIIAVTGWGADEDRRRSREAGFDAHLVKPVDYAELQKYFTADNIAL